MGGFGEAKIIDFRTFFIICSMQNLECKLEGHLRGQEGDGVKFHGYVGAGSVEWRRPFGYAKSTASTEEHVTVPYAGHP